ncbi:MAG: hypothetical protein WAN65_10345 [Candidatus Sulfotelmatobacter sp.]
MDPRISKLKTPKECETFEKNAQDLGKVDLAIDARKRAVVLRAQLYGAVSEAERECLEAVYAYEKVLSERSGKKTHASRTWQMIKRRGIIGAVESVVNRKVEATGFTALLEMGLEDYAFEAVVVRHPTLFTSEALERSRERLAQLRR